MTDVKDKKGQEFFIFYFVSLASTNIKPVFLLLIIQGSEDNVKARIAGEGDSSIVEERENVNTDGRAPL